MNRSIQYEIKEAGKPPLFTSVEESVLKHLVSYPDTRIYIRTWYGDNAPPSDQIEITELIRQAIVLGRERG